MSEAALARRSAAELVAGSGLSSLLSIAFVALAGRILGAREYADLAAALALLYMVGGALSPIVPTLSHFAALHLERGEADAVASLRRAIWQRTVVAGLCLLPVAAAGAWFATGLLRMRSPWTLPLALAAVFLYVLLTIDRAVLQGSMQFRRFSINAVAESGLRMCGIALLLAIALAPMAMAIYVVSLGAALLLSRLQLGPLGTTRAQPIAWRPLIAFAAPNLLLMMNFALQQNADVLVVRRSFDAVDAGSYGAAATLVRGIGLVAIPFAAAAVPALTVLRERGKSFTATLLGLCGSFVALGLVAVAAFAQFGGEIVRLLYGAEFIDAALVLGKLSMAALLAWLAYLLGQSLIVLHRFRFLWFYSAMIVVQLIGYALFHETLHQLIHVQLVCQAVIVAVLGTMAACWANSSTTSTPKPPH